MATFALDPDGRLRKSLEFRELDWSKDPKKKDELRSLLSAAMLVVDARLGGLKDGLLDEKEDAVPRTADDGQEWLGEGGIGFRVRSIEASAVVLREGN